MLFIQQSAIHILLTVATLFITLSYLIPMITSGSIPLYVVIIIIYSVVIWIEGFFFAWWASYSSCSRTKYFDNFIYGLKNALSAVVVYFIVYFIPMFRQPFYSIAGNGLIGEIFTYTFYLVLATLPFILVNYYDSIKNGCKLSMAEIDERSKELDKKYEEEYKKLVNSGNLGK